MLARWDSYIRNGAELTVQPPDSIGKISLLYGSMYTPLQQATLQGASSSGIRFQLAFFHRSEQCFRHLFVEERHYAF